MDHKCKVKQNEQPTLGHSYIAYMDGTDFLYEEGRPLSGNLFFDSVEGLEKHHAKSDRSCLAECGIVKIKVELIGWEKLPETPNQNKSAI